MQKTACIKKKFVIVPMNKLLINMTKMKLYLKQRNLPDKIAFLLQHEFYHLSS